MQGDPTTPEEVKTKTSSLAQLVQIDALVALIINFTEMLHLFINITIIISSLYFLFSLASQFNN